MNVMSHEIINTITLISSLAENLEGLLSDDISEIDYFELSKGLNIIKNRSNQLNVFVDNYRKLSELPLPNKSKTNLITIVNDVIYNCKQELGVIDVTVKSINESVIVNIDQKQIEQVLLNLLINSIYALKDTLNPEITVEFKKDDKRTIVSIIDNGIGVPDKIKDNIFMPYYTTRKNGSGIGLTLSRSIMQVHNGKLLFNSNNNSTCFSLVFIT